MISRVGVVVAALVAAAAAPAAHAQVAVATAIVADDAAERDLAALVVRDARARWQMLSPPFVGNPDAQGCKPGDNECLRAAARKAGATHLLVVAVAPAGVRDHIVAVQLFAVGVEAALFEESVVQPGGLRGGTQEVASLAARLVAKSGPPPAPPAPAPKIAKPAPAGPGATTWIGVGLVSAGAAGGVATLVTALALSAGHDPENAGAAGVVGIAASCGLVAVGGGLLAVDWFASP